LSKRNHVSDREIECDGEPWFQLTVAYM